MNRRILLILMISLPVSSAMAEDWPQWRGPAATGAAPPMSVEGRITWRIDLPGRGSSTPITWEENILLTSGVDGRNTVLCFDASGTERWRATLGKEREARHRSGSGSNPSPVTDGQSIFAYFKSGTVAALDFDGATRWTLNLQETYGADTLWWDLATSPVLAGSNVVIAVMQAGPGYVIGLDKETGRVRWKVDRTFNQPEESDQAYTTPAVHGLPGNEQIVVWGADHVTAHAAATGRTLWTCDGFNPDSQRSWRAIASAVAGRSLLLVPYGRGNHLAGIGFDGKRKWHRQGVGADVPTPVARGHRAYVLGDKGTLTCLDIRTGKIHWTDKLPKARARFFASPLLAGDSLICPREDGVVFIGRIHEDRFALVKEMDLGEPVVASPVPFQGQLLVRSATRLMLID